MQFEQLITASNIKFVENRMLVNKNFGITIFVKSGDQFNSVQTIQGVDSEVFDCNGPRLVFFASSNEVHCYEWNGSEYVYVDNIINEVAGHSFGDYIAVEENRVALSLKDLSTSEVTIKYYDLLEESTTTDILDVISPVTLESSLKDPNNNFGWDVSISGDDNMIAVGEPNGETNLISYETKQVASLPLGDYVGISGDRIITSVDHMVYVYEWDGSVYQEIFQLNTNPSITGWRSVDIDGDTIVVGYPLFDIPNGGIGKVEIYNWSVDTFVLTQTIISPSTSGWFGYSVSINDDKLFIGRFHFTYPNIGTGNSTIHVHSNIDSEFVVLPSVLNLGSYIVPRSISFDGTTLAVATNRLSQYDYKPAVITYNFDGNNFTQKQIIEPDNEVVYSQNEIFETSVSHSNNNLVIGYNVADNNEPNAGLAVLYKLVDDVYVKQKLIQNPETGSTTGDLFGFDVSLSGTKLAITSKDRDVDGTTYVFDTVYESVPEGTSGNFLPAPENTGRVSLFQKTSFGYSPAGEIISPRLETTGSFGGQLSMSLDGSLVAVSEIYDDETGEVHVYNLGPARYRYTYTIKQPTGFFGWDVSFSDNLLAISAFGHIFIYSVSQTGANLLQEIAVPNSLSGLSLTQNTLIANIRNTSTNTNEIKAFSFDGINFQETSMSINGAPAEMGKISLSKDEQHLVSTSADKVYIFKNNGSFQFELIKTIEKNGELPTGVEFGENKLILGYPFETFTSGDIGYGEAGRAYLYDITTRQEVSFYDAFTYKGTLSDVFYPTNESDLLEMHNKNIYINSGVAPGNAKVSYFDWDGTSYSIKQVIGSENTPNFANEYKLSNDASKLLISLTNSAGQKQIDEYIWDGTEYVYERSIKPAGNTTFVIDDGRVITGEITSVDVDGVQTPQGNMQVFVQKPQLVESGDSEPGETISAENYDELDGAEYTQVRIHLGVPYEKYIDDNGFVIHEKLPDITTENFLNDIEDVRDLYVNFDSEEIVRTSQSDTIHIYDIMLGQTVSGKYRLYLNSDPYIEIILYVSGGGSSYAQGIADRYVTSGLKMNVKYPSPNIKMERNTIPRLKSVTFE